MKRTLFFALTALLILSFHFYKNGTFRQEGKYDFPDASPELFSGEKNVLAKKTFVYKSYEVKTGELIDNSFFDVSDLASGEKLVTLKAEGPKYTKNYEYVLDSNLETTGWRNTFSDEETSYIGRKEGDEIMVWGKLKGKDFDKTFKIDSLPLYINPKISLGRFVNSNAEYLVFWAMREDTVSPYKMEAFKRGTQTVLFNGQPVETVRVYWAASGVGAKFFNRTYLFRKSDGTFLLQEPTDGWSIELISEEEQKI